MLDNEELRMRVLAVLDDATDYDMPTLDWMRSRDIMLSLCTTQKLARVVASLIELGLVRKGKMKKSGRMVYRLISKMIEAGYQFENLIEVDSEEVPSFLMDWELLEEMRIG